MRKELIFVLGAWLFAASPFQAQTLPIPAAPRDSFDTANPSNVHAVFEPQQGYNPDAFLFWVRCDFVVGMVKRAPLPIPLVTTGDAKDKQPGAIGQTNTQVQLGNAGVGFKVFSGMRVEMGAWIDPQHVFGIEAGGFVQETRVNHFSPENTGTSVVALPFLSRTPGSTGERALVITSPGKIVGSVVVDTTLQRWGTDADILFCFYRQPGLELTILTGLRYEDLREDLRSYAKSLTLATNTTRILDDHFNTRNQFFGAQLGGSIHWHRDVWTFDVTGKLALGDTHQVVEIQGTSSQSGPKALPTGTVPGGLFTQPSNLGRNTANPFTVIPTVELRLGYQFTPWLRTFVGYDFLYWSQVVRPGDQIDRNVNLSQNPILGTTGGNLSGPAVPASRFQRTSFWGQDVNFGLEIRF